MTFKARKLQVALKCKLMTGSYEGKSKDCPCIVSSECRLSENERKVFKEDERVFQRSALNRLEYERLNCEVETTQREVE